MIRCEHRDRSKRVGNSSIHYLVCCGVAALATLVAGETSAIRAAAPSAKPQSGWLDPLSYYALLRQHVGAVGEPEIVEMVAAIVHGSDMGPGDGWFHASLSRYGWSWLAARYDANHDGKIMRSEFRGPAELFDRLDRNHDGELSAADFDWSDRSLYAMQGMPARMWFSMIDANGNGRITRQEWDDFFARAAKEKGYLTPDDLREMFPTSPPPRPAGAPRPSGPSMLTLLKGLAEGELGSPFEGPGLGQRAPDFGLTTQDGKRAVRLSQFHGRKPVVLIFGSFT
jgi:hypothetical protein